jgi:hypothetical protein
MPNDISESLGVPIISGIIETIDALKHEEKVVATYQTCIEVLFKYTKVKEATVFLANGESITIDNKNKISTYNIIKKNMDAIAEVQQMDITSVSDKAKLECIITAKSYMDSIALDKNKDKMEESLNSIVKDFNNNQDNSLLKNELDIVNEIALENKLGSVVGATIFIDNKPEYISDTEVLCKGLFKSLLNIILPKYTVDTTYQMKFEDSIALHYILHFDSGKELVRDKCEFNIIVKNKK